jgi:UDP-N-acetylglucosamine/UDP-N-acetylgalactosamine diphosphorylase
MFDITQLTHNDLQLPSGHSLFQMQAERIVKVQQLAKEHCKSSKDSVVPWYIMTSDSTKGMTIAFFEQHRYFGLDKRNVFFFEQASIPCLTPEGKIILQSPHKVLISDIMRFCQRSLYIETERKLQMELL